MPATTTPTRQSTSRLRDARRRARDELWRAGDLSWLLDFGKPSGPQRDFYERSKACSRKTFVNESSRRIGKSVALVIIAFELALKNPGARINWCQDTSKGVRSSAIKTMEKMCRNAPPDCRGRFNTLKSSFEFPNGAYIFVFGGNTQEDADTARGGDDPIASFFDEGGFMRFLKYIYRSIVKPGMRRVRRLGHYGMIFVSSSTPEEMDHYFIELANLNEVHGSYCRKTIYDSDDPERYITEEAADAGMSAEEFVETDTFKREFLCQRVVNEAKVVFPEFHIKRDVIVREWPRPVGFEKYVHRRVSIDLGGMRDKYGFLYGYTDFASAKIVIEDEALLAKPNTEQVAAEIVEREARLWMDCDPKRVTRVIDDDTERTIRDLWDIHKVASMKATKQGPRGGRAAAIGMIRTFMQMESLIISPRCVELQKQLLTAMRNSTGTDFERTDEGHSDLCAALMYFVRDLSLTTNPYPSSFNVLTGRELPAIHPMMARAELMGRPAHERGLAAAILGGNRFVRGRLRKAK